MFTHLTQLPSMDVLVLCSGHYLGTELYVKYIHSQLIEAGNKLHCFLQVFHLVVFAIQPNQTGTSKLGALVMLLSIHTTKKNIYISK